MKVLLAIVGLVVVVSHVGSADQELADKLKPYEAFSPYKWTQWVAMRPSHRPVAAAAVAYAPQVDPQPYPYQPPREDSLEDDDDEDDEEDDEDDPLNGVSAFANWFKRAILPQPPPTAEGKKAKKTKTSTLETPTTKKPSIVELPLGFWAPPTLAPNLTGPPPPGYYAAKKSMFISKLFAALAASVLNETEPLEPATTTVSPRQAILDELSEVLLSDVARSAPEETTTEPEEFDDSDEDSSESDEEEHGATVAPRTAKAKATTVNPFLLSQIDFLAKLTEAIAATQQQPTAAPVTTPKPRPTKPTTTTTPKPDKKTAKKAAKKSAKKMAKTPAYMKWIPTTTTPSPTTEGPATQEIDYDALARALLGNSKI